MLKRVRESYHAHACHSKQEYHCLVDNLQYVKLLVLVWLGVSHVDETELTADDEQDDLQPCLISQIHGCVAEGKSSDDEYQVEVANCLLCQV